MAEASTSTQDEYGMESQFSQLPEVEIGGVRRRHSVGEAMSSGAIKRRLRDTDEEELWTKVGRVGKRIRSRRGSSIKDNAEIEKIEAYVTSGTELPKQFAFALFLKNSLISDILQIKYISSYKILIQFANECSLEKLSTCQAVKDKGWRVYRTLEVESSYGVIRKVELDLKDEDIINSITCDAELLSVKRLSRRSDDGAGWTSSECVRLCFKGSSLPPHVYVHGIRVRVGAYTFPVTQCSFCWAFGHPRKMCPRKKVVCPKCSKHHENCETTSFVCVNCTGNHLALSKKCPIYLKERKIRTIMADFNCTYRKALTMYVPATSPVPPGGSLDYPLLHRSKTRTPSRLGPSLEDSDFRPDIPDYQRSPSYASVAKSTIWPNKHSKVLSLEKNDTGQYKSTKKKQIKKNTHSQKVNNSFIHDWNCCCSDSECGKAPENESNQTNDQRRKEGKRVEREEKKNSFEKILEALLNLFFRQQGSIADKLKAAAKTGIEWLISFLAKHLRDLPLLKSFLDNYG